MATKKARMLVDHDVEGLRYKCNSIIEADAAIIKQLVKDGMADDTAAAVKHLEGEGVEAIVHVSRAEAEAKAKAEALQVEIAALQTKVDATTDAAEKAALEGQIKAKQDELAAL